MKSSPEAEYKRQLMLPRKSGAASVGHAGPQPAAMNHEKRQENLKVVSQFGGFLSTLFL